MDADCERDRAVAEIKDKIEEGRYRVDVRAVADAIVRQLRELAMASTERVAAPERKLYVDSR